MSAAPLPDGSWPVLHDISRWVGSWLFCPWYRLHVHGRGHVPATGPVVLVANHSASIDGPLLFGLLGRRSVFLVKHELYRGVIGSYLRRIGQLPVRRGEAERTPLLAAVRTLRGGGVIGVFPEGTRGAGDVASARQGAAWLARSAGAVVLPVACRGTRRPAGTGRRFRPRVDVLFGAPVPVTSGHGRAALAADTARIRDELAALVAVLDEIRASGSTVHSGRTKRRHREAR
jgi:1-acyl-sn-glycerol-3-phosphate acyltransferase